MLVAAGLGGCGLGGSDLLDDDEGAARSSTTLFTGDAGSAFCDLVGSLATLPDPFAEGLPPVEVADAFAQLDDAFDDLVAVAPARIEADLTMLDVGLTDLPGVLDELGYDFLDEALAGEVDTREFDLPAYAAAGDRVARYRREVCGA